MILFFFLFLSDSVLLLHYPPFFVFFGSHSPLPKHKKNEKAARADDIMLLYFFLLVSLSICQGKGGRICKSNSLLLLFCLHRSKRRKNMESVSFGLYLINRLGAPRHASPAGWVFSVGLVYKLQDMQRPASFSPLCLHQHTYNLAISYLLLDRHTYTHTKT